MPRTSRASAPRSRLFLVAGSVAALYLAICLYFFLRQDALVFYPSPPPVRTPADAGLAHRELSIATADGERLHAWLIEARRDPAEEPRSARPTVLYSHGNAGNVEHRIDVAATLAGLGCDVLLYDYRGYGKSSGRPSEAGVRADALAVHAHLVEQERVPPARIVLFGESLGGAVSIDLATRAPVGAVIVEDTFTSIPDLGAEIYPWLPIRLLARTRFDSAAKVARIGAPLLVIHSPDDRLVPLAHGRALIERAREPKTLLLTSGGHNAGGFRLRPEWIAVVARFLADVAERAR